MAICLWLASVLVMSIIMQLVKRLTLYLIHFHRVGEMNRYKLVQEEGAQW